jgi:predicted histone-like DNA-binding protein
MTVKFTVVTKRDPRDLQAAPRYYPMLKSTSRVTLRQLAERIGKISTVSVIDVIAVLEALLIVVPQELANGNLVDLGGFGSFRLRVNGRGAASAAEVTARNITRVFTRFRPGRLFREVLNSITFERTSA